MYWHVEIPSEYTDITLSKNEGTYPKYEALHLFVANVMIHRINESLNNLYISEPDAPQVELEYEKHSSISDVGANGGFYTYDFFVRMKNRFEEKRSQGYRIRISAKSGQVGEIGIRAESSSKKAWMGEVIHTSGRAVFPSDYIISNFSARATKESATKGSATLRIWTNFSYILTERAFLLFTARSRQPMNIISFISCEDLLKESAFVWLSNGWRDSIRIDERTKRDLYRTQTISASPNGKIRLYEYIVQNEARVDKWFMPNIYLTAEHKTNNHLTYMIQHNNLSIGKTEFNEGFCCLINTLPVGTARMAVVI